MAKAKVLWHPESSLQAKFEGACTVPFDVGNKVQQIFAGNIWEQSAILGDKVG
jgi:hypothetical protein